MTGLRQFGTARSLIAGVAFVLASVAAAPASAQNSDTMSFLLEKLGIKDAERDPIDYRERAPLVVPPSPKLVEPRERIADADPRWPKDPDLQRKKRQEEERRKPVWPASNDGDELRAIRDGGRNIRSETLPRGQGGGERTQPFDQENFATRGNRSFAETSLFSIFKKQEEVPEAPYTEPPRRLLTDPPTGLRAAAGDGRVTATKETGSRFVDPVDPREVIRRGAQ